MEEVKEEEDITMGINRGVEHVLLTPGEGLRFVCLVCMLDCSYHKFVNFGNGISPLDT